jgi:hypothetical protein
MGRRALQWRVPLVSLGLCGLVVGLAVAVALATPPVASAYVGPNPVTTDWESVWDLMELPDAEEAGNGSLSDEAKGALWRARVAAGTMPALNTLGTMTLASTGFELRWKVGRTSGGTRWLHWDSTEDLGNNVDVGTGSGGGFTYRARAESWTWLDANDVLPTSSGYYEVPTDGFYLLWRDCVGVSCTPGGGGSMWITSLSTYSGWVSAVQSLVPSATAVSLTQLSGSGPAYAFRLTEEEVGTALGTPDADEAFVSQTFTNQFSGWFVPANDPGGNSATADDIRAILLSGGVVTDNQIGHLVDGDWDGLDDTSLLEAYAPAMRFSPSESYLPTSAALATDTFSTESPAHANRLERDSEAVASADPDDTENALPLDNLSLSYLGGSALTDDKINMPEFAVDEPTSALIDYAYMLSEHPGEYENKAYGRVVQDPEESGERILQYWFYYYYNPKTFYTIGNHEGDWEWLQIKLDASGNPTDVTFSQHGEGETCSWSEVMKNASGQAVVWPAIGSHANYFAPGDDYTVPIEGFADGDDETAEANDFDETTPDVIDITSAPAWIEWDGSWGASGSTFYGHDIGFSPRSPGVQGGWSAFSWPEEPKSCSLS